MVRVWGLIKRLGVQGLGFREFGGLRGFRGWDFGGFGFRGLRASRFRV